MTGKSPVSFHHPMRCPCERVGFVSERNEHLDEMDFAAEVVVWFIEEAVSQSGTNKDAEEPVYDQRVEFLFRYAGFLIKTAYYHDRKSQSDNP